MSITLYRQLEQFRKEVSNEFRKLDKRLCQLEAAVRTVGKQESVVASGEVAASAGSGSSVLPAGDSNAEPVIEKRRLSPTARRLRQLASEENMTRQAAVLYGEKQQGEGSNE